MPLETAKDWLRLVENALVEDSAGACSMCVLHLSPNPSNPEQAWAPPARKLNWLLMHHVLTPYSLTVGSTPRSISFTQIFTTGSISGET